MEQVVDSVFVFVIVEMAALFADFADLAIFGIAH